MKYLQWAAWAINVPCQALLLQSLIGSRLSRYPFLFSYVLVLFLWTVANIAASEGGRLPSSWAPAYWIIDLVAEALLFGLVLSLVHRALKSNPKRGAWMRMLIAGVILVWLGALVLSHGGRLNQWMTNFTKYTAFAGAILNLFLWLILIGKRHPDRTVLMISGGYGVQSAGEAISQSLRALSVSSRSYAILYTGNLIGVLAHSLCLLIWWRAVSQENTRAASALTRVSTGE